MARYTRKPRRPRRSRARKNTSRQRFTEDWVDEAGDLTFFPVNQAAIIAATKADTVIQRALLYQALLQELGALLANAGMPEPGLLDENEVDEDLAARVLNFLSAEKERFPGIWQFVEDNNIEELYGSWDEAKKLQPGTIDYGILQGKGLSRIADDVEDVYAAVAGLEGRMQRGYGQTGPLTLASLTQAPFSVRETWRRGVPVSDALPFQSEGRDKEAAFLSLGKITDPAGVMLVPVETGKDSVRVAESVLLSALSAGMWDFARGAWAPGSIQFALPYPDEEDKAKSQRLTDYLCGTDVSLSGFLPGSMFGSREPVAVRIEMTSYDPASIAEVDEQIIKGAIFRPDTSPIPFTAVKDPEDERGAFTGSLGSVDFSLYRTQKGWEASSAGKTGELAVTSTIQVCPSLAFRAHLERALSNIQVAAGITPSMKTTSVNAVGSAGFFVHALRASAERLGEGAGGLNNTLADTLQKAVQGQFSATLMAEGASFAEDALRSVTRLIQEAYGASPPSTVGQKALPVVFDVLGAPEANALASGQTELRSPELRAERGSALFFGVVVPAGREVENSIRVGKNQKTDVAFFYLIPKGGDRFDVEPLKKNTLPLLQKSLSVEVKAKQEAGARALKSARTLEQQLRALTDPIRAGLPRMPIRVVYTYPQLNDKPIEEGGHALTYYGDDMILRAVPQNRLGWRRVLAGGKTGARERYEPTIRGMQRYGRMDLPADRSPRSLSLRGKIERFGSQEEAISRLDTYTTAAVRDAFEEGGARAAQRIEDAIERSTRRGKRPNRYLSLENVKGDPNATQILTSMVLTLYGVLDEKAVYIMETRCGCGSGTGPEACQDRAHRAYKQYLFALKRRAIQSIQDSDLPAREKKEERARALALPPESFLQYPIYSVFWQSEVITPTTTPDGSYDLRTRFTPSILDDTRRRALQEIQEEQADMPVPEMDDQDIRELSVRDTVLNLLERYPEYAFFHSEAIGVTSWPYGQPIEFVNANGRFATARSRGPRTFDELSDEFGANGDEQVAQAFGYRSYADLVEKTGQTALGRWARGEGRRDIFDVVTSPEWLPPAIIGDDIVNPRFLLRRWASYTSGLNILAAEWAAIEENERRKPPQEVNPANILAAPFELLGAVSVNLDALQKSNLVRQIPYVDPTLQKSGSGLLLTSINLIRERGSQVPVPELLVEPTSKPGVQKGLFLQPVGVVEDVQTLVIYVAEAKWDGRRKQLSPVFGTPSQATYSLYSPENIFEYLKARAEKNSKFARSIAEILEKGKLERADYYAIIAEEADPGPSRTTGGQRAARRAVLGLERARGGMARFVEGRGMVDPDIAEGVLGTKRGRGPKNLMLFALQVCRFTGRCAYRSVREAVKIAGTLSDINFVPFGYFGVTIDEVADSLEGGGAVKARWKGPALKAGKYLTQVIPPVDEEESLDAHVTVKKGKLTFELVEDDKDLQGASWVYGDMVRYGVPLPETSSKEELIERLVELRNKLQGEYELRARRGYLLDQQGLEDEFVEASELVKTVSPRKNPSRYGRKPRRRSRSRSRSRVARRNGLTPNQILTAEALAEGREVTPEQRADLEAGLEGLGAPADLPFTRERINQLFPRRGKERGTWEISRRFPRLADVDLVSDIRRPAPATYSDFAYDETMPFQGDNARTVARQAQLSVLEAGNILRAQKATRRRGYTQQPSSAICSLYRRRKLKTFLLPANIYEAVNVNRSIIILMSPIGDAPRVMTWRRGSHIDCDMTGTEPAELSFFLGKAIQSALFWVSEKRGRLKTTIYVGRIGDDKLYTAWTPDNPVTVASVTEKLRAASAAASGPALSSEAALSQGIILLEKPEKTPTSGSGLNTKEYYQQAYRKLFGVSSPQAAPRRTTSPPPPKGGGPPSEGGSRSGLTPSKSYEDESDVPKVVEVTEVRRRRRDFGSSSVAPPVAVVAPPVAVDEFFGLDPSITEEN